MDLTAGFHFKYIKMIILFIKGCFTIFLLSFTFGENRFSRNQAIPLISELNKQMGYFRMKLDEPSLSFAKLENNNTLFTIPIKSRRNNYEEMILLSYGCIGRSIQNQLKLGIDSKKIIRTFDILGRKNYKKGSIIIYIFDDGTVEKKIL